MAKKFTPVFDEDGSLKDVIAQINGRSFAMIGNAGKERELQCLQNFSDFFPMDGSSRPEALPVLIGSGMGYALNELIRLMRERYGADYQVAVIDNEPDLLEVTQVKPSLKDNSQITWISGQTSQDLINNLLSWQEQHGDRRLIPFVLPFYLRLDNTYYGYVKDFCSTKRESFWDRADYPKFAGPVPRVLMVSTKYFLFGDVMAACDELGIPYRLLALPDMEMGASDFIKDLLEAVLEFRPDFLFTINHIGVDREGVLVDLLERLRLPLASWFVDNPQLILHSYHNVVNPWTCIFTWDVDNIVSLKSLGFEQVHYMPLATDIRRFYPDYPVSIQKKRKFEAGISFVGNSMVEKVQRDFNRIQIDGLSLDLLRKVAAEFSLSDDRLVFPFLEKHYPDIARKYSSGTTVEQKIAIESTIISEATLQYRLQCIQHTFPYHPLIVGDPGWHKLLLKDSSWRYHKELAYYDELPAFYPCSKISFNATSAQMKGAVNQRVFDVPATASFLLTDYREQMENLFDLDTEVICYREPEQIPELIERYLHDKQARQSIALAARKRVLADHTYTKRVKQLVSTVKKVFR